MLKLKAGIAVVTLTLLVGAISASAKFLSSFSGSVNIPPTTQNIASLVISNNSFTAGVASGTLVGALTLTLAPTSPPFSGSLSLVTTGTDHSGTACSTNSNSFQLSGLNLQTNGVLASGSYTGVCVKVTQASLGNSPYTQAFTITGNPQTVAGISLPTNTFPAGSPSGTTVTSIMTTMSPTTPAFSGTYSLINTGTDHSGSSCTSASNSFAISGNNLNTNGVLSAGTFNGVCIKATETGVAAFTQAFSITGVTGPSNTMTVANVSGSTITNYPLQFGRAFLQGAIPHNVQVLINGTPVTTQANVKNRYPDGSVKFAVISYVVPTLASSGSSQITFADTVTTNVTPMTTGAMVSMMAPGDAVMKVDMPAELAGNPGAGSSYLNFAQWTAITNGSFCITIDGGTPRCPIINFSGISGNPYAGPGVAAAITAALGSDVYVWADHAGYTFTIQNATPGPGHTISVATSPSSGTDISANLGWTSTTKIFQQSGGTSSSATLVNMLNAGVCTVRTPGPIAQQISCADDTTAASFDVGFDGTHHPFRPRFYATFWPAINKVEVHFVGDGTKTTELTDMVYQATLSLGGSTVYTLDLLGQNYVSSCVPALLDLGAAGCYKRHWVGSSWSKDFWLGSAPPAQVNIDPNASYMVSTRFLPSFDTTIVIPPSQLTTYYNGWNGGMKEPYDGGWDGGLYTNVMSQVGGRQELGPYPVWDNYWLYTGDWRMIQMGKVMVDLFKAFPNYYRETQTGRRLQRTDTVGSNTGLGKPLVNTDRPLLSNAPPYLLYGRPAYASAMTAIGPIDSAPLYLIDGAHLPAPDYIPYLLSGDVYDLDELLTWAITFSLSADGQSGFYYGGRGPDGREGVIQGDSSRGVGWPMRQRAEAAFIAEDGTPEKSLLGYLTNDEIARVEGALNITGTPNQTAPVIVGSAAASSGTCPTDCNLWTWGHIVGSHEAPYMPSTNIPPPTMNFVESYCNPTSPCDAAGGTGADGSLVAADVGSVESPWMQGYYTYGFLRARDLGFAATPISTFAMVWVTGLILDSGSGDPRLSCLYRMPVALQSTANWIQTWPDVAAHVQSAYYNGTSSTIYPGGLPGYCNSQKNAPEFYLGSNQGVAALGADLNVRGLTAYNSSHTFAPAIYNDPNLGPDPRWSFVPRTDSNVLPNLP